MYPVIDPCIRSKCQQTDFIDFTKSKVVIQQQANNILYNLSIKNTELATLLKNLLGRQLVQYLFWLNKQRIRRGGIRCTGYNIRYLVEYMVCLRTYQTTDRFYGIWKVEIFSLIHKKKYSNVSNNYTRTALKSSIRKGNFWR